MSAICDRCGAETSWIDRLGKISCPDCFAATIKTGFTTGFADPQKEFLVWLERVIDRRVQKVLAERELP